MEHLDQAIAALDIHLEDHEVRYLEELYVPHRVLGHT
jgi:aryl-alcohol dehydrogenase (NADP+)